MNDNVTIEDMSRGIMSLVVRFIGLFLLLAGLWLAFQVMLEALDLYREPHRIERFARAIEQGSNIDKSLVSIRNQVLANPAEESGESGEAGKENKPVYLSNSIRVSYFFAWIIVMLLLLLIARISLAAIKTGGELVLYDMQIKQFAKMLVKESTKTSR